MVLFLIQCQLIDEWRINDPASFSIVIFGVKCSNIHLLNIFIIGKVFFGENITALSIRWSFRMEIILLPFSKNMWNNCHKKENFEQENSDEKENSDREENSDEEQDFDEKKSLCKQ